MQHLKGFGLENFRVFKDYTWFDFAPITLLIGPNSSGKSSLIKALLLTEENKKQMPFGGFEFSNGSHDLGSFKRMLNDAKKELVFEFPIELRHIPRPLDYQLATLKLTYKYISANSYQDLPEDMVFVEKETLNHEHLGLINVQIYVKGKKLIEYGKTFENIIYFDKAYFLSLLKPFSEEFITIKDGGVEIDLKKRTNAQPSQIRNKGVKIGSSVMNILLDEYEKIDQIKKFSFDTYIDFLELYKYAEQKREKYLNSDNFCKVTHNTFQGNEFVSLTKETEFISNDAILDFYDFIETKELAYFIHKEVLPFYFNVIHDYNQHWEKFDIYDLSINIRPNLLVEYIPSYFYLSSQRSQIKRAYTNEENGHFVVKLIEEFNEKNQPFLRKWSKYFNLTKEIEAFKNPELLVKGIKVNDRPLVELGFGISQLTILLLSICGHNSNKTIIFEEPEANLHPAFQSKLADMFYDAHKTFNQQFIIETHSEYMVRKFQYLVAKGEMKKEDIVIYYFNDPNNIPADEPQVKKIEILEDGSLSDDFGSGFFDEAANWELELLRLKKNKIRQN